MPTAPDIDAITAVDGLQVGHWTNLDAATGCTVVLCPEGVVASADIRGGAPGTRETDLLRPGNLVDRVHAVLLSGGSAFGLDAAAGVMRWLEERGHGFPVPTGVVPIVVGAVLIDLSLGRADIRPDAEAGYAACQAARAGPVEEGSVGAGTGATVAKALGMERALKGGLGTAAEATASGVTVGALVAANPFGEIVDPDSGRVVAGPRGETPGSFAGTLTVLRVRPPLSPFASGPSGRLPNSTIGVVATDAALSKEDCYRLAVMAQAGLARAVRPIWTPVDGDTIFALATGRNPAETDVLQLGALAARAVERAVLRAVAAATGLAGVPSAREWTTA
ncbi:MAG TPA: P1 family peptidase [Dehalococcoidia bacterium]|nr:P1 family peptidase [Dehalococcoidia bacterium]